ncbi:MAG: FAD/NAD(P)-binding protein [Candidatus Aenigmarchaeota archaeon]|nr:FAD/NAD(P)-binding protein [Candidatus Aenigmarchaeota archaeon]
MKSKLVPRKVKVLDVQQEAPDISTLTLDCHSRCVPGQFVQVSLLGVGECPLSIASHSEKYMKLTVQGVGTVTKALCKLKKGDHLYIRGPYGKGYPLKKYRGSSLILVGAGCGVAALKSVIDYVESHRKDYKDVFLFFGYRYAKSIAYKKQATEWKKKFNLRIALSREKTKSCLQWDQGHVTDLLKKEKLGPEKTAAFVCGPLRMINDTVKILKKKGFADTQIYMATERLMYCGTGACCHCMIRGKLACTDGPVFRFDEIGYYGND